jgi:maleylacetoacetate isomerase
MAVRAFTPVVDGLCSGHDEVGAGMKLFTYWRSQAAFRVRVAMRLKGLAMEKVSLDLLKGDQFAADYLKLNPEGVVPTLIDGDGPPLVQSLAILEYLDEKYPQPPLLPKELRARAHARALAQMVAMDSHPFIVPRVRKYLDEELHLDEPARAKWVRHWLDAASRAIEEVLAHDPRTGRFCLGDQVTVADICLAAHLTSAKLFGGRDPNDYPVAGRIHAACMALPAFAAEHPLEQPDAQASARV